MADNQRLKIIQFEGELKAFAEQIEADLANTVVDVAVDLFGKIVERTPWDTGTARANWNPSVGVVDVSTKPKQRYSEYEGTAPSEESGRVAREKAEEVFGELRQAKGDLPILYISNALDYIDILENGRSGNSGSDQAPNGMVLLSVQEVENEIATRVKK